MKAIKNTVVAIVGTYILLNAFVIGSGLIDYHRCYNDGRPLLAKPGTILLDGGTQLMNGFGYDVLKHRAATTEFKGNTTKFMLGAELRFSWGRFLGLPLVFERDEVYFSYKEL